MSSTVILGAGIIGVSTAYYLSDHQPPSSIHLVDPAEELFSSASGYAGGFLARDWFGPSTAALGALSYDEHRRLAEKHGGREKWGYSNTITYNYVPSTTSTADKKRGDDWLREGNSRSGMAPVGDHDTAERAPSWLRRQIGDSIELSSEEKDSTAQVDPLKLCQFLLQACLDRGVQLHQPATALSVSTDVRGELASICVGATNASTETDIPCTRLIIAAGAWSASVYQSLFKQSTFSIPISSLAGHSLMVKSPLWHPGIEDQGCHAIYTTFNGYSPEVFARLGGHLYIAGVNSSTIPLPKLAGQSKPQSESIGHLRKIAATLLGSETGEDNLEIVREGLCFRPITAWNSPIIARIPDQSLGIGMSTRPGAEGGVFLASGHGPWGISMSLGTGVVLAELAQGQPLSADIRSLGFRS